MNKVLVIGGMGNMGQRYLAILKYLQIDYISCDVYENSDEYERKLNDCTHIIIATPTKTHCKIIESILKYKKPILCEKPISTNIKDTKDILKKIKKSNVPFDMVMQYKQLINEAYGSSYYNYFKHGGDGMAYDCIQIIGLAKGPILVSEDSPIWHCIINGQRLNLSEMDTAYVYMVSDWLRRPNGNIKDIFKMHLKVERFKRENK